ncbi:spore coat protein [Ornithinibacillus californiensis]|uniref:spore coat protein n=1 Tax=Ornithinibacillus californiensis TaxID=161536 RepID=UPI00064DD3D1|nr:spore coat protein [Ornithinibacillus californiensis]
MVHLPAVDLGLMAEHLSAHQGAIQKLHVYEHNVSIPELRETLQLQRNVMEAHVKVMLELINPNTNTNVEVPNLEQVKQKMMQTESNTKNKNKNDKWIALEAHNTAKSMSNQNYMSALMMKNKNVRDVHVEMALQQLSILERYDMIINNKGWTFTPKATYEEQLETYNQFLNQYKKQA